MRLCVKIYIAGPMRGLPHFNFDQFDSAKQRLNHRGYAVVSPADLDRQCGFDPSRLPEDFDWCTTPDDFDFAGCVERDIDAIKTCDAIYMLDGWEHSVGAKAELALAQWLGLEILYQTEPEKGALPEESSARKEYPLYRGLFQYFPRALCAISHHSWGNNEKHNPGEPLHWSRHKSDDHEDALLRHVIDGDWQGVAWRALARLEVELETLST